MRADVLWSGHVGIGVSVTAEPDEWINVWHVYMCVHACLLMPLMETMFVQGKPVRLVLVVSPFVCVCDRGLVCVRDIYIYVTITLVT